MADPVPAAPAAPTLSPGWKTTEFYVAMLALGALLWLLQSLVGLIPTIAAMPGVPPWAIALLGLAPVALGWVIKLVAGQYGSLRRDLKLADAGVATTSEQAAALFNTK